MTDIIENRLYAHVGYVLMGLRERTVYCSTVWNSSAWKSKQRRETMIETYHEVVNIFKNY